MTERNDEARGGAASYEELLAERRATIAVDELLADAARLVADFDTDPKACARELTRRCSVALQVARAAFWQRDGDDVSLVTMFDLASSEFIEGVELRISDYPEYWDALCRDGRVETNDAANDPRTAALLRDNLARVQELAVLDIGVRVRERVIGVFSFHHLGSKRLWKPHERILVQSVAHLLALHLEMRARQDAERERETRRQATERHGAALARIGAASLSSAARLQALQALTEAAAAALGATSASVWLEANADLYRIEDRFVVETHLHESGAEFAARAMPAYHQRLIDNRCVAISDGAHEADYAPLKRALFADEQHVAVIAAAVRSDGRPVGVVTCVQLGVPRSWTVEEEVFIGALSDLASFIVESFARREAERQVLRSQERLRLLFQGTPFAAIDWDPAGRVIGWNPAAERLFLYPSHEALNQRAGAFFPPEHPIQNEPFEQLCEGANLVERFWNVRKDGQRVLCDWRNTLLLDAAGVAIGMTSLVEDVTERVEREEEIRQLNSHLEQRVGQRTQALKAANDQLRELDRLKNEFVATMSHELRTPLNSIIGFSGVLKAGLAGPLNDEQRRQLEMVSHSAHHLLGLINDLLDLSRIEAGQMRVSVSLVELGAVVEDVKRTLQPLIQLKGIELQVVDLAPGLTLRSDQRRLFQILINLANNAVKFTERGTITITLRRDAGFAIIDVQDTGPGISQENLRHLFRAFRQVDGSSRRVHEGTGLGLYLSKQLSSLLGGSISAASEVGVGSCFSLKVPLRSPGAES